MSEAELKASVDDKVVDEEERDKTIKTKKAGLPAAAGAKGKSEPVVKAAVKVTKQTKSVESDAESEGEVAVRKKTEPVQKSKSKITRVVSEDTDVEEKGGKVSKKGKQSKPKTKVVVTDDDSEVKKGKKKAVKPKAKSSDEAEDEEVSR
jgi:hypothetical protein